MAGLFAAFAGVMFALNYRQVHPFMGEVVGLKGISAMIVGGMGNIWGVDRGRAHHRPHRGRCRSAISAPTLSTSSVYGLLLLILFVRPTGLFAGMPAARGGL